MMESSEEDIQRMIEEKYSQVPKITSPLQFSKQSAAIGIIDGKMVVPETRQIQCACKNKVTLWRVTEEDEFPPLWAGICGKCRGKHLRGEAETVKNLTNKQYLHYVKLGHRKQRIYSRRRRRTL